MSSFRDGTLLAILGPRFVGNRTLHCKPTFTHENSTDLHDLESRVYSAA